MTLPQHLGDLLSALVDAELTPGEEAAAYEHLSTCRHCTIELEQVTAARALVRNLPSVEPPLGFIERVIRQQQPAATHFAKRPAWPERHRGWAARWAGVAAFAATATAAVALVGLGSPREPSVQPAVGQLVEAHATGASLSGDPLSRLAPVGVPISFKR